MKKVLYELGDEVVVGTPIQVARGMVTVIVSGTRGTVKRTMRIDSIFPVRPVRKQ